MRVALDCRYIRERPSGIGTYVQALVDRLPALAPDDDFLFWAHPLAPRPLSAAPNARTAVVRVQPNSPLTMWWPRSFAPFDRADVFHNPQNVLPRGIPCASVVTLNDVLALEHPSWNRRGLDRLAKSLFYPQAVWRALRSATRLIVLSAAMADRAMRLAPEAAPRIRVIPDAADPVFCPPADAAVAARGAAVLLGGDAPYFLVVGENAPAKRHDLAIRAFAAAVPPPWRLVLVQRLGSRARLVRLARAARVADRIVWLRNIERDAIVTLMQSARALLQPSVYEGFGLPVVEAMACGCPVIASDIPVLREISGGAAMLVPPGGIDGLAAAMRAVAQSRDARSTLTARGLERARDFSWDRAAAETLTVYREAAASGASTTAD